MLVATSVAMLIGLKLHRLKVKMCRKLHYTIENPPKERFFPLKKRADSKNSLRNRFKKRQNVANVPHLVATAF